MKVNGYGVKFNGNGEKLNGKGVKIKGYGVKGKGSRVKGNRNSVKKIKLKYSSVNNPNLVFSIAGFEFQKGSGSDPIMYFY